MENTNNDTPKDTRDDENLPGYPPYLPEDDIYNKNIKISDIVVDDSSTIKAPELENTEWDDVLEQKALLLDDIDVPGSELDDDIEDIGSEDEENNYYSLGGDNHDDWLQGVTLLTLFIKYKSIFFTFGDKWILQIKFPFPSKPL